MEKKIQQNHRVRWKVVWLLFGTVWVLIGAVIVVTFLKKLSIGDMMPMILIITGSPLAVALFQKLDGKAGRFQSEWILRDEGLEQIRSSGEREMILWGQIRRMFWVSVGGLIALYEDGPESRRKPLQRLSRATIWIGQAEAAEIAEIWRRHYPRNEADRVRRVVQRRRAGVGLMCLGVVIACVVGPLVYQAYQSYQWPSVEGKIVSMEYELNHSSKYPMGDVQISYEYAVDGSTYQSERVRPLSKGYRAEAVKVKTFVNGHQQGMSIKVYYDPKHPADAVLLPGPDWAIWGPLLPVGPLFVLLGWRTRTREVRLEF